MWVLRGGEMEAAFPRRAGQGRFRLLAWSDAERLDMVPNDHWMRLAIPK
jgi:hypothetical protein